MHISKRLFGTTQEGRDVHAYTLENGKGMKAVILDYGCIIQSLIVPDRNGKPVDVVLGYNTIKEYETQSGYLGAAIGRVGNRIGAGEFTLNGETYHMVKNDRGNTLHGGIRGFDKKYYVAAENGDELVLSTTSADMEEGFPGDMIFSVRYGLTEDNALKITYVADTTRDTLYNPTNHSYFNLAGHGSVLSHELMLNADAICECDVNCLPTGKLIPVEGTPFDFRSFKQIGRDIGADDEMLHRGNGYDHNFCIAGEEGFRKIGELRSAESGIAMTCESNMPGVQIYTANGLSERDGKQEKMGDRYAVCMETQIWPDAVHHGNFPSGVLKAGCPKTDVTVYRFSTFAE